MKLSQCIAAAILSFGVFARGATVVVPVTQDTTLFELSPTFNLGATTLGAGGINIDSPDTQAPARMRALMRFDLAGIPSGAHVISADLTITVVRVPPSADPTGSTFELRRVLKPWGEGNKTGLTGVNATAGEATWLAPSHPSPSWEAPGASGPSDTAAAASSSAAIDALDTYTFSSTPALVADVQNWLTNPSSNFGWLMKSDAEQMPQSARRFASRESATGKPTLTIVYEIPPPPFRIQQFELRPEGMFLSWTGGAPPYEIERAENISGPWTAITTPSSDTQAIAPTNGPVAFYRVVSMVL
jgi:hypothetical protein